MTQPNSTALPLRKRILRCLSADPLSGPNGPYAFIRILKELPEDKQAAFIERIHRND